MELRLKIDAGKRVTIDKGDGSDYIIATGTGSLDLITSYIPRISLDQVSMSGSLRSVRTIDLRGDTQGPIGDFANLPGLENIAIAGEIISGDIGGLSGLITLVNIDVSNTNIDGDFGQLSGLSGLTAFYAGNTSIEYTTAVLPVWNGIGLDFEDCGWVESMVDAILVDLDTSGSIDGEINLLGCAPPGASGLAAIVALESNGWSVDVE